MGEQELYNIELDELDSQSKEIKNLIHQKTVIIRKIKALEEKELEVKASSTLSSEYFEGYFNEKEIRDMIMNNLLDTLESKVNEIKSATQDVWSDTHGYIYNKRNEK